MRIDFSVLDGDTWHLVKSVRTNSDGRTDEMILKPEETRVGQYELLFHVDEYFARQGVALPDPPILNAGGCHGPYFLRNIVEVRTDAGMTGVGETYGGPGITAALERARNADVTVRTRLEKRIVEFAAAGSAEDRGVLAEGLSRRAGQQSSATPKKSP